MMTGSRVIVLGAALACSACLDFTEPELPQRATATFATLTVRAFDTGSLQIDGSLQPGRDSTGFQRVVQSPFIQVNTIVLQPTSLGERGLRTYGATFPLERNATAGPYTIRLPDVRDLGTIPVVQWNGLLKVDGDTIRAVRGEDIVLRLDTLALPSTPAPFRQWFLDIRSGNRVFRLSSDGLPPLTLRIPAAWVPSTDPRAFMSLIYFQTGQVRTPNGLYAANLTLDTRMNWVVVFSDAP